MRKPRSLRWISAATTFLWLALFMPLSRAAESPLELAQKHEKSGRWFEACCLYEEMLNKDRNQLDLRESYRRCLRQFRQQRRLDDPHLQATLGKLSAGEAGDLYEQILGMVGRYYADRERLDPTELFQQGMKEVREALDKKTLRLRHTLAPSDLLSFRAALDTWASEKPTSRVDAGKVARRVILAASQQGLPAGVVALELACGAANSLDEYSLYLAPGRVGREQSLLANKTVGIGVELALTGQRLEVTRVYRKSPAAEAGLMKGDIIVRIDGRDIDPAAPDIAAERLLGDPGSAVEIEVLPRGPMVVETFKIKRQAVLPSSIDFEYRMASYIGYIQIHSFQKSTVQEVKTALASFQGNPLVGVILDLRGNPGGLLDAGMQVAELFLPESAPLAHTTSPVKKLQGTFRSQNAAPMLAPLAVLVDSDTASAAEVLAGALKDNQRAFIVGHTTYGKGSIQSVIPLERGPGGLKLTVAKFTTPLKLPVMGRGIVPTHPILDPDPEAAIKTAEGLLRGLGMMMVQ